MPRWDKRPIDVYPPVKCHVNNRQTGEPCKQWATPGTTVCHWHGGPRAWRAAARRVKEATVESRARRAVVRRGGPKPIDDPLRELQGLAAEAVAFKDQLAIYVKRLRGAIRYKTDYGEQLRAEVVVYERALDRAGEFLAKIARLKIDERLAAIDAAKKLMVIRALEAGLTAAGISGPKLDEAKKVTGRHLRMITAGEPIDGEIVDDAERTVA